MEYSAPGLSVLTKTLTQVPYGNGQFHVFLINVIFKASNLQREDVHGRKSAGKLRNLGHVKKLRNIHNKAFI